MGFEPDNKTRRTADPNRVPQSTDWEPFDAKVRNITAFVILMLVTLGFYWFYVVYHWTREVNGWLGEEKYSPALVLLLSILSCGVAGLIFECLFAYDIEKATAARELPDRRKDLGVLVLVLNLIACMVCGFVGIAASAVIQSELNKLVLHYAMPGNG